MQGWSALYFAAHLGHETLAERLLAKDLSIKANMKEKDPWLILAVKGKRIVANDALLRIKAISSQVKAEGSLHHASRSEIVRLLFSHQADINDEDARG